MNDPSVKDYQAWEQWIGVWSQFPLDGFLQSTYEAVMTKVEKKVREENYKIPLTSLKELKKYLPWPDAAITWILEWLIIVARFFSGNLRLSDHDVMRCSFFPRQVGSTCATKAATCWVGVE